MVQIGEDFISNVNYPELIEALIEGFNSEIQTPPRNHINYQNPNSERSSTLLIMPSWQVGNRLGVKLVTVSPDNYRFDLPSIHGQYVLFDALNGKPIAMLDAKLMTSIRTAAVSAMVSKYLSRSDSKTLLMVGTGALAPELIKAHSCVRNIEEVLIWGRNAQKAELLADTLKEIGVPISVVKELDVAIQRANIISCATLSETPLIKGELLKPGQHLDLVGSFQPHTREADDACIRRASIFVDTKEAGLTESGDIAIPISKGVLQEDEITGDIKSLTSGTYPGREYDDEITLFKSVGHASEDLIAASYFYDRFIEHERNK